MMVSVLVKPNGKRGLDTHHIPSEDDPTKPKCGLVVDGPSDWREHDLSEVPHTDLCSRCAGDWGGGSTGTPAAKRLEDMSADDLTADGGFEVDGEAPPTPTPTDADFEVVIDGQTWTAVSPYAEFVSIHCVAGALLAGADEVTVSRAPPEDGGDR